MTYNRKINLKITAFVFFIMLMFAISSSSSVIVVGFDNKNSDKPTPKMINQPITFNCNDNEIQEFNKKVSYGISNRHNTINIYNDNSQAAVKQFGDDIMKKQPKKYNTIFTVPYKDSS